MKILETIYTSQLGKSIEPIDVRVKSTDIIETFKDFISEGELSGAKWGTRIIATGLSKNLRMYPESVLIKSVSLLEGSKVYAASGKDHSANERGVRSLVGFITNPTYESNGLYGSNIPGIYGDIVIVDEGLKGVVKNLHKENALEDYLGLSIVSLTESTVDGNGIQQVLDIIKYDSVDIVEDPAAGGMFLKLKESLEKKYKETHVNESEVIMKCKHGTAVSESEKAIDVCESCKSEAEEAMKYKMDKDGKPMLDKDGKKIPMDDEPEGEIPKKKKPMESAETPSQEVIQSVMKFLGINPQTPATESRITESANDTLRVANAALAEAKNVASKNRVYAQKAMVAEAKLPDVSTQQLFKVVEATELSEDNLQILVNNEKDKIASLRKAIVENVSKDSGVRVRMIDPIDKKAARIQAIFEPNKYVEFGESKEKIKAYRSFTEAYCDWYDVHPINVDKVRIANHVMSTLGFDVDNIVQQERLSESLVTADLAEVLSQFMHKALIQNYETFPFYQNWRKVTKTVDALTDYKVNHRSKFGTYEDLGVVGEAGVYPVLDHPTDEETTLQMQKRGGIADQISREAVLNDDLRALASIPSRLAMAANRTLYKAVFNRIRSTAFLTAANNNLLTTAALTAAHLDDAIILMRDQTSYGGHDVLGETNLPQVMCVPNELEGIAKRLIDPSTQVYMRPTNNQDVNFDVNRFKGTMEVIVVDFWTNSTDWILVANPMMHEGLAIAFLGGRENPELFIQNDPRQGEAFTMDVQNIKVRHEWTLGNTDYRPFAGYRS